MDGQKESLIGKIWAIREAELNASVENMDTDLIAECSEFMIELMDEKPPSENELEQTKKVLLNHVLGRRTASRKYQKGLMRKLLIAAIIVMLIAVMSLALLPIGGGEESMLSIWGSTLLHLKQGEMIHFGDYMSIYWEEEGRQYKSIRQFATKSGLDVLIPTELPEGLKIKKVLVYYNNVEECPIVIFVTNDPMRLTLSIYIGKEINELEKWERTERIAAHDCGVSFSDGNCQCAFNENGNGYSVSAESYEDTVLIVNSMKAYRS